jgi:hypothetical protein
MERPVAARRIDAIEPLPFYEGAGDGTEAEHSQPSVFSCKAPIRRFRVHCSLDRETYHGSKGDFPRKERSDDAMGCSGGHRGGAGCNDRAEGAG